jgi:cobalt/nickel transport system ATP-binding protein
LTAPVFELTDVTYRYHGAITALAGIDLVVAGGESVVLLGANGSGKSTLLQILDGLLFPAAGRVRAFGAELTEEKLESDPFRRFFRSQVGFVFQNPDIQLFCPTVAEEAAFGPLQLDLAAEETAGRVEDVLAMLGLGGLRERSPLHLSGGEKKKVALASVLTMNPAVLLLDEPTTALDPRTRYWFMELAQDLAGAGKTIVTATHDLALAERIATRVVVIGEDHRVAAAGTPAEILTDWKLLVGANLLHEADRYRYGGNLDP